MEIKIDTNKDTPEEIRKMISFLHNFINENPYNKPPEEKQEDKPVTGMFDMFSSGESGSTEEKEESNEDKQEEDTNIKIVPY